MIEIIDKIKKLRLLATSSNVFEAAAAAAQADKLISKFRISEAELGISDKEGAEEDQNVLYETSRAIMWKRSLSQILAEHYGCVIWNDCIAGTDYGSRKVSRYRLVGRKADIAIVSYMFAWLLFEIERLTKLNCKGQGHIVCQSYSEGAVVGINDQLKQSRQQSIKEAEEAGQSQALVKLDERIDEANVKLKQLHPKLRTITTYSHRRFNRDSYNNGVQAGRNIHLGKAMGPGTHKLLGS